MSQNITVSVCLDRETAALLDLLTEEISGGNRSYAVCRAIKVAARMLLEEAELRARGLMRGEKHDRTARHAQLEE